MNNQTKEKKIAILQSNYIPWKGYFDLINMVDTFVIYDEVQYTNNDWRNRNKIKGPNGLQWLTIPCRQHQLHQTIDETKVALPNWNKKHLKALKLAYSKSSFFKDYQDLFEELYLGCNTMNLSKINFRFIKTINKIFGIQTKLIFSRDLDVSGTRTERLLDICKKLDSHTYLSGPAAKSYLDEQLFNDVGINVEWMDYSEYPEYSQLYPPFEHKVSVLDLIFNMGADAIKYLKSF